MKKQILLSGLMILGAKHAFTQYPELDWVKTAQCSGGEGILSNGCAIAVADDGSVYSAGSYREQLNVSGNVLTAVGNDDAFLQKHNAAGNLLWVKTIGGTGMDIFSRILLDSEGNLYVLGYSDTTGNPDIDPGPGTFYPEYTTFLLKLDPQGEFVWGISPPGGIGYYLGLDGDGNVIVGGRVNVGQSYIRKYNPDSAMLWEKLLPGMDMVSLKLDDAENIYFAGSFMGTLDFDPGPGTFTMTATGGPNGYIEKMSPDGIFIWARAISGSSQVQSVHIDDTGDLLLAGAFSGQVDLDMGTGSHLETAAGNRNFFIEKLDQQGAFVWAKTFPGMSDAFSFDLQQDGQDNIYFFGRYSGTGDFDPGPGTHQLTGEGIFLEKLSSGGDFVWVHNIGSDGSAGSALITEDNKLYLVSALTSDSDLDLSPQEHLISAGGSKALFVAKYINVSTVSLSDLEWRAIKISSNPTSGSWMVSSELSLDWSLFNLLGQELVSGNSNGEAFEIDATQLTPGIYLFKTPYGVHELIKR